MTREQCASCGGPLVQADSTLTPERRQVFDLPELNLEVTQHRVSVNHCQQCQQTTGGAFPDGVASGASRGAGVRSLLLYLTSYQLIPSRRSGELCEDLFGQPGSEGTLQSASESGAEALAQTEPLTKQAIVSAGVGHFDETGRYVAAARLAAPGQH